MRLDLTQPDFKAAIPILKKSKLLVMKLILLAAVFVMRYWGCRFTMWILPVRRIRQKLSEFSSGQPIPASSMAQ
ncbi:tRNA nucleotidyltransferase [Lacticaseibacillus casei A2-362]|uniref:tRNA nucleotidyltransferase n=1 Tax=Lacticaseibacillus paracasei subsp. paracasei Lpp22 TaxID=1256221 RepID=A0A8E0IBC3_LACPA|nr:tRNA nucleotidyltransferase [Lacticaseibacillus casei A2-362]EPC30882.1 tRNA nucleotidyltransferase [Lacticaseibacillus paracasei subsp. paracasei Lpp22]